MLQYFRPLRCNDYTLSVDNVVADYYFHPLQREELIHLLQNISFEYCCELTHWESFKMGSYKLQFTISLNDGNSFWLGLGLNQSKTNYGRVRIEYNPNKVANHDCFRKILAFLNCCSRPMHTRIVRYDLAIDFPVLRENVFIVKDNRQHRLIENSLQDRTDYLGPRSGVGAVKLYNKQMESGLSFPMTRLELTLDPVQEYEDVNFPEVYYLRDLQLTFDELKLVDTDRFIINALLHGCGNYSMLGYRLQKKYKNLMQLYVNNLQIEKSHFEQIRSQLKDFLEYPVRYLDDRELDLDYLLPYRHTYTETDFEEVEEVAPFED